VVRLERHRRLAAQQAPPPAALQALVQRLVHRHHTLHARAVGAVGLDAQAHVAPPRAGAGAAAKQQHHAGQRERREQLAELRRHLAAGCGGRSSRERRARGRGAA
jgi:hypothetical protein